VCDPRSNLFPTLHWLENVDGDGKGNLSNALRRPQTAAGARRILLSASSKSQIRIESYFYIFRAIKEVGISSISAKENEFLDETDKRKKKY